MRLLGWSVLAAVLVGIAPVYAADAPAPLWSKTCGKGGGCLVEQFVSRQADKTVLLHIRFDLQGGDGNARMALDAPLGVFLPPGMQLSVDGSKPIVLPYERCTGSGCQALAVLDKAALDKIQAGKTLNVHCATSEKAGIDLPVNLDGLAKAIKSLKE